MRARGRPANSGVGSDSSAGRAATLPCGRRGFEARSEPLKQGDMTRNDFKPGVRFCRKGEGPWAKLFYELDLGDSGMAVYQRAEGSVIRKYVGEAHPTKNNKGITIKVFAINQWATVFIKFSELELVP